MTAGAGKSHASGLQTQISTAVCCMCGDLGISEELFGCKSCGFRSQHRYCSELYPKAEAYNKCNWCLREARGKSIVGLSMADGSSSSSSSGDALLMASKLQRGVPLLQLAIKPAKKLRPAATVSPAPPEKLEVAEKSKAVLTNSGRLIRQPFRGKVRRYKLLEEVTS